MAVGSNVIRHGQEKFQGDLDTRLGKFLQWLNHELKTVEEIALETPGRLTGKAANASLFGMCGVLRALAYTKEIPVFCYAPTQIKKHISGRGNCDKAPIIAWAEDTYGPLTSDEADALALMDLHLTKKE